MTNEEAIMVLEAVRQICITHLIGFNEEENKAIDMAIEALKGRPQGEWKPKNHHTDYCSSCGFEETQWHTADYNFCPNCGERMKGGDSE